MIAWRIKTLYAEDQKLNNQDCTTDMHFENSMKFGIAVGLAYQSPPPLYFKVATEYVFWLKQIKGNKIRMKIFYKSLFFLEMRKVEWQVAIISLRRLR